MLPILNSCTPLLFDMRPSFHCLDISLRTDRKELISSGEYAVSQLQIVRSDLHLVTYLDVGNFCNKSTETTLHERNSVVL